MLARIPSKLLSEWMAFGRLEPFGFEALNMLAAGICCATIYPHVKKTPDPETWLLDFDDKPEQTVQEMRQALQEVTQAMKKKS